MFIISIALITSNKVRTVPTPKVPHDFPQIQVEMNDNVSDLQTIAAIREIEAMVLRVDEETEREFGQKIIRDVLVFNQGRTEVAVTSSIS